MSVIDELRLALAKAGNPTDLAKADTFVQSSSPTTGLTEYDLEPVAKNLYPVLSPLRNRIPRISNGSGTQANWKAVLSINSAMVSPGVAEGMRGGLINVTTGDYFAAFRGLGLESSLTYEAEYAAQGFDNLRARSTESLLQSMMEQEERVILGGNTSYALGQTPTPTLAAMTTGGSLPASTTVSVICVALTYDGTQSMTLTTGILGSVTRQNADGTTSQYNAGSAIKSANATVATAAGTATNSVVASITPVRGAYGYAWFAGTAGAETLQAITSISQYVIQSISTAYQLASALPAADCSRNGLVHDGLLGFIGNSANGSYYAAATPGQGLTADGAGGVVEIDAALKYFWDNLRLSPSRMLISSQEVLWIRKKILLGGSAASTSRFTFNIEQGQIVGGGKPRGYLNPFTMGGAAPEVELELHPYMTPGTIMFMCDKLPYLQANIQNLMQIKCRKDYYSVEWPKVRRAYVYGVYSDQVLQHYFMPSLGVITNLSPA
jgi:hypothetical protein